MGLTIGSAAGNCEERDGCTVVRHYEFRCVLGVVPHPSALWFFEQKTARDAELDELDDAWSEFIAFVVVSQIYLDVGDRGCSIA